MLTYHERAPEGRGDRRPKWRREINDGPAIVRQAFGIHEFVNADVIARGLSEFAPETVAVTAGRVMLRRIKSLALQKADFAFETTLASRTFKPMLHAMQLGGYEFHLTYLWLQTPELAIERVRERLKLGGASCA